MREVTAFSTSRFDLRPLRKSDAAALFPTLSDPVQCRFLTHPAFANEAELWGWLSDPEWTGRSWIAVEQDGSDVVVGRFIAVPAHENGVEEIGYIVCVDRQRQGIARECVVGLIDRLFAEGTRKIIADVDSENNASYALLDRLGFTREATFRQHETTHEGLRDLFVYGLLSTDPRPSKGN